MNKPEVFISYSWETKSEEIADDLDRAFAKKDMKIIRDTRDIAYRDLITEFMQRLGAGKYVILVISGDYLKSQKCMYELLQIAKHERFKERIFPLRLESAKIYKPEERVEYLHYWKNKIAGLEEKIKEDEPEKIKGVLSDLELYREIRDNIDRLTDILADMNTRSIDYLRKTGYREIIQAVQKTYREDYHIKQIKILAITASPEEADPLLYEKEQDTLLDAFRGFEREEIFLDMPDPVQGTMQEIEDNLVNGKHDILQITAHGGINKEGKGILSFENAFGELDEVTGSELAEMLMRLREKNSIKVSIVVLSSCHSARMELHLLPTAEALHRAGIDAVIGMAESISHLAAIDFNVGFFTALQEKKVVAEAFQAGLDRIAAGEQKRLQEIKNWDRVGEEKIPRLLVNNERLSMADFSGHIIDAPGRPASHEFLGARALDRGFIGRRDILRKVYKDVKDRVGYVVLKGPGGIGKSTITTRAAAQLHRRGYDFIVIQGQTSPEGILQKPAARAASYPDQKFYGGAGHAARAASEVSYGTFQGECTTPKQEFYGGQGGGFSKEPPAFRRQDDLNEKLSQYLEGLRNKKVVFIFDNFEENQEVGGRFLNERLRDFLWFFRDSVKGSEVVLFFSSRYRIPGFEAIDVSEFSDVESRKMVLNQGALNRLPVKDIGRLMQEIGGNPRAVELLDKIAYHEFGSGEFSWQELKELIPELAERIINKAGEDDDFTPQLLGKVLEYISVEQRRLLDMAAVYRIPVVKAAIEAHGVVINRKDRERLEDLSLIEYSREVKLYYVHRLTARYVLGEMDDKERRAAHLRAAGYFESLRTKEGQMYLNDAIEARRHLLEAGEWERAAEITFALEDHLSLTGYPQLAFELLKELPEDKIGEKNRSIVYHDLGILYWGFGKYDMALKQYEMSMDILEKIGDMKGVSASLHQIGILFEEKGDYDAALNQYKMSLEIDEKIGDIKGVSYSLHQIGMIYQERGDYDAALQQYEKSREILEKIGDMAGVSYSLHQIGMIYQERGDYDAALQQYEKSREILEKIGDIAGVSKSLHQIGMIYQERGDYDAALKKYEESLEKRKKIGDIVGISDSLHQIGMIYQLRGEYDAALKQYEKSLEIKEKIGDMKGVSYSLHQIGRIYQERGDYDAALKQYEKSREIDEKIGDMKGVSKSLHQIGMIYQERGDYDAALKQYEKSLEIKEKIGDIAGVAASLHQIGMIYQKRGDYDAAFKQYEKSKEIFEKIGDMAGIAISFGQMGNLSFAKQDYPKALRYSIQAFLIFAKIGSPNVNIVSNNILEIKEKIPTEQFAEILKEYEIPEDHFDKAEKENQEKQFITFLIKLTADAIQAKDKGAEEKAELMVGIEQMLSGIPETPQAEGLKSYFEMLLALMANEDIEEYKKKIPGELLAIFEKTKQR